MMLVFLEGSFVNRLSEIRKFKTEDIARRLGIICAKNVSVLNYPEKPIKVFNPSFLVVDDRFLLYPRMVFGYYKYVSAIGRIELELNNVISGKLNDNTLKCEIVIYPSTEMDFWGAEDPRTQIINDIAYMIYTGRTRWYFERDVPLGKQRDVPVIARSRDGMKWEKIGFISFEQEVLEHFISIKNSVFVPGSHKLFVLHRIHTRTCEFYTSYGMIDVDLGNTKEMQPITSVSNVSIIKKADFEQKIGWGTPPVKIANDKYIVFLHGVDKELLVYRVFAVLIKASNSIEIEAVSPYYIMEPKEIYEIYGDRPYVIFPCGASKIDDEIIITYGAADSFIGIAKFDTSELLHMVDKGYLQ